MVNLKKFCRNLRNEMVSHITFYLPSIAKPSLRYLDLILSKTRFSSHISFLSRCLRYQAISNGFKSSFSLYVHSPNYRYTISRRVTKACYEHSRRLMRIAIDSMSSHIANLDLDIAHTKSFLFSICPSVLRRDITNFVRMLNSRLYSFQLYSFQLTRFRLEIQLSCRPPSRFGQQSRQLRCSDQSGGHDSPRFNPIRL